MKPTDKPFDFSPWEPPFLYDDGTGSIFDAKNRHMIDVRGWGMLTGKGQEGLGMTSDDAMAVQNRIGERVTMMLNELAAKANQTT